MGLVKSGDIFVAALACMVVLFLGRWLRMVFRIRTTGTATVMAITTFAARALRWPHLLQLFQLVGGQNFLELRLRLGLQGRHLFLLVGGQVELLHSARRQQMESALADRTTGAAFAGSRTITGWRRTSLILSRCGQCRHSECQRQNEC